MAGRPDVKLERLSTAQLQELFPALCTAPVRCMLAAQPCLQPLGAAYRTPDAVQGTVGLLERKAGHISPRAYVEAHRALLRAQANVTVLEESAVAVAVPKDGEAVATVRLRSGTVLKARKALVATGAFADASLCNGYDLPINVEARTVLLKDVTELLAARPELRLQELPSIITGAASASSEMLYDEYQLPPILYPNGRVYLKVGTGDFHQPLTTLESKRAWFGSGPHAAQVEALVDFFHHAHPCLDDCTHVTANCAICFTAKGYPILDWVPTGRGCLAVAVGGNGSAAKSADEIGRLAALVLDGAWDPAYPRDPFALV